MRGRQDYAWPLPQVAVTACAWTLRVYVYLFEFAGYGSGRKITFLHTIYVELLKMGLTALAIYSLVLRQYHERTQKSQ